MDNGGDSNGVYTIPTETNLKKYYIKGEYTDEHFGTGKVIAPVEETNVNDRFYVMALEDVNSGINYCWYDAAFGKLDKLVGHSDNDFGKGRENTEYVNSKWNDQSLPWGVHNNNEYGYIDMLEVIQDEIADGWFVPSKSEWSVFGKMFNITNDNYDDTYGLNSDYWSSSQEYEDFAYRADFNSFGYFGIYASGVGADHSVRLATTF